MQGEIRRNADAFRGISTQQSPKYAAVNRMGSALFGYIETILLRRERFVKGEGEKMWGKSEK